ncbi:MAG: GNAT family N-acetyltransferase [Selenomonadaceae bacterium]|nr:GNAT family N-acetyltransferase [Selenomonadaceae bacterium]
MNEVLIEGKRLRLRRANVTDLGYIMALQFAPENLKFIVPFDEDYHRAIINSDGSEKLDVIIEEIDTGIAVGYFMLREMDSPCAEYTHVIIDKKGIGYGREALKLLLKWTFEIKKFHRVWIDCKEYNSIALHLYESSGFIREGVLREYLLTNGVYENLIVLGMLAREYFARYGKSDM